MKKIVASVGLVALGVSSSDAAYAPGLSAMDTSKALSLSVSLRGFYDDNIYYSPRRQDSFGVQVRPSVQLNFPLEQTYVSLGYLYDMRWYEGRSNNDADHLHQVDLMLDHAFSERYLLDLQDSFVIAQEPDVSLPGAFFPYRTDRSHLRNQGRATFHAELTRLLGVVLGYHNTLYSYENDGGDWTNPSLAGLLDRMEHLILANLRWQALPETTAVLGYNFGLVNYTGDEYITLLFSGPAKSDIRDNRSHYVYGGIDQTFLRNLTGSIRLGAQFVDYDNDEANEDTTSPYADVSLSYTYATGSYAQIGFTHMRNATDVIAPSGDNVTSDQQSSVVYARVNHRITPKLVGSVIGQYQNSSFHGGLYDEGVDQFFMVGLNLMYHINPHLSAEVGYNYDNLDSDLPAGFQRDYHRNRVYVGINASY